MWSQRRSRPPGTRVSHPIDPPVRAVRECRRGDAGPGEEEEDDPVVVAPLHEVLAALESVDLDRPWAAVAPDVLPVLPRRRPLPSEADPPVRRTWPPGLEVAFGVDIGPAFLYVGEWALRQWGITLDELSDRAIENVRRRAASRHHFGLLRDAIAGMPLSAFQSREGWASALLLVPDQLTRVFGPEPCLLLTPMRDLVLQLPIDADTELAAWLMDEFASMDPNGLALPILALVDGELAVVPGPGRRSRRRH